MTAETTGGRWERKKSANRAAIRNAALRLSLLHGVEKVTLRQITAEADLAPRTFFHYFSSKEEAVVAAGAALFQVFAAEIRARPPAESVLEAIGEAVMTVMDTALAEDSFATLMLMRREPSLTPQVLTALAAQEEILADAIAERVGAEFATTGAGYPRLCAAVTLAAMRVALDSWLETIGADGIPSRSLLRSQLDQVLEDLARGLDRPGAPGSARPEVP